MSGMIELTAYSGKFLGPIAKVLGWIMSGIYDIVLKNFRWYDQQCTAGNRSHDDFDLYVSFAIDNPAAEILETFAENAAGTECDP